MEKDIIGFEGIYKISKSGVVTAYKRNWITGKNLHRKKDEHELKIMIDKAGYKKVPLCKNGQQKQYYIHRLLAQAFIDNPDKKSCINHIDGNKLNNDLTNLEWVNYSENAKHAFRIGLKNQDGGKNPYAVKVKALINGINLGEFGCLRDLSKHTGISYSKIYNIYCGRSKNEKIKIERITA